MILITRPREESELLKQKLSILGLNSIIEPLSSFKARNKKLNKLKNKTILLSSPRATKYLIKNYSLDRSTKFLIIGNSSTLLLKKANFKKIIYTSTDSKKMLKYIKNNKLLKNKNGLGKIIYFTSNVRNKSFVKELNNLNIEIGILYSTIFKKKLSIETVKLIKDKKIEVCLLYSQENAKRFIDLIHQHQLTSFAMKILFLSLSKKISKIILDSGFKRSIYARQPNQRSLIRALMKL